MVRTRRIRYSRDATATPPPAGSDGSAQQSPGSTTHGLTLNDGDEDDEADGACVVGLAA